MRSENAIVKFTMFVLILTMLSLCLVSNTYAKYTSTFAGSDTAIVARWDVSAGDAAQTTINLFDVSKIYDTNGVTDYTAGGTDDTDVRNGTTDAIIAPGTWGSFAFTVSNNSDVTAEYTVDYTVTEAGIPLEWSTNGTDWSEDLSNVSTTTLAMNTTQNVTVYWRWAFTKDAARDTSDTTLGTATTLATPEVTITTTFTQVD